MGVLIRSKTVMEFFDVKGLIAGFRTTDWNEPEADRGRQKQLLMQVEDWVDMGEPKTITVTVEVGDTLNDELDNIEGVAL
jgi:hypothetical protein